MEKTFKLLVAIDASKYASEVIEQVQKRNWSKDTQILLITVLEEDRIWEAASQYMHQCQIILETHAKRLQEHLPHCKIRHECMEGKPAEKIVESAAEWQADLLIIGSHGDTGVRAAHVGSVAANVVNIAPCSVEVIKVAGRHSDALNLALGTVP